MPKVEQNIEEKDNVEVMCVKVKETSKKRLPTTTQGHGLLSNKGEGRRRTFNAEILNWEGHPTLTHSREYSPTSFRIGQPTLVGGAESGPVGFRLGPYNIAAGEFYGASDTARTATGAWNVYKQSVQKSTKQGVPSLGFAAFEVQQGFYQRTK